MRTTYLVHKIEDLIYGNQSYSIPATWYFSFHLATQLSTAPAIGQNTIVVNDPITVGSKLIIEPFTADASTFTAIGSSGSGPYTITLDANITKTHATNDLVSHDPGPNGENAKEPSVGSGHARVAKTNNLTTFNSAVARAKTTAQDISFPTYTSAGGTATHLTAYDASSSGNLVEWWALGALQLLDTSTNPVRIPAGNLTSIELAVNA